MRSARDNLRELCKKQLTELRNLGLLKTERIITSAQAPLVGVQGQKDEVLNLCANNYLGLANDSKVIKAASDALKRYGAGMSSVRFICGTQDIHKDLESKLSQFHQKEDTILYASCFDANAGLFEALLGPEDVVFSDELNHASIIDGIRLCKAEKIRYKHRDMTDLELKLKAQSGSRLKLIVTDGVFSMDGNVAPIDQITQIAQKYKALTMVDDCHATGFFGKTGRGTEEYFNVLGKIDLINSTLGKAMGGAAGGYTTGPKEVVNLLRQRSRPYLFSNSLPPPVVAAASQALDLVMENNSYQADIKANTDHFRREMTKAGFRLLGDDHPICPIMIGDAKLSAQLAEAMINRGIYVVSFNYPVVPRDKARIRVQLSAAHTPDQISRAIKEFVNAGQKIGILEGKGKEAASAPIPAKGKSKNQG